MRALRYTPALAFAALGWMACRADSACRAKSSRLAGQEKAMRENMSQRKLDKMIDDSFPASDPPSTY